MIGRRHRVIVHLVEVEEEDVDRDSVLPLTEPVGITKRLTLKKLPGISTSVEVVNEKTLLLNVQNQRNKSHNCRPLNFDCVGYRSDPRIRLEISGIVDQLLMYANDSCLLKFSHARENLLPFISNVLISEIDKKLLMLRATIHTIKLEYYDIQKYDVVNLLAEERRKKRRGRIRNQFNNTMELHKWFQSEFLHLWNAGQAHDCIDLQIVFLDISQRIQKVKLSFFSMYLNKMDADTRGQVLSFFQNMGSERRAPKQSLITDCLKEYLKGPEKWRSLVIFEVPMAKKSGGRVVEEMLKLANAAYLGVQEEIKSVDMNASELESIFNEMQISPLELLGPTQEASTLRATKAAGRSSPMKKLSKGRFGGNLSGNEVCGLSQWYTKIDQRYLNVIAAMEEYYDRKYDSKISKLCGDIKEMMHTIDQTVYSSFNCESESSLQWTDRELLTCYSNFKSSLMAFRRLSKEIEESQFSDLLKIYLKTKAFELAQHAVRFKAKQLVNCRERLSGVISDEMIGLNSMEQIFEPRSEMGFLTT